MARLWIAVVLLAAWGCSNAAPPPPKDVPVQPGRIPKK